MKKVRYLQALDLITDQVTALDSAMLVAQTAAEKGPVHKLRTSTRRMEAQLILLEHLPGIPMHSEEAAEVHRLLKRIRRAAATVRDLDVQMEIIEADMPEKTAIHEGTRGDEIRRQARKLLKRLGKRRAVEAEELVGTLRAESEAMAASLRALQQALKPTHQPDASAKHRVARGFTVTELSTHIQNWFRTRSSQAICTRKFPDATHALQRLQKLNDDALHEIRKAAKQCRYMAESFPEESANAKRIARRFEFLQEAGGRWHDWLMLEEFAARVHGKKATLSERYRHHRNAALAEYHLQLALEFTTGEPGMQGCN